MYRYSPTNSGTSPVSEPPEVRDKTTFSLYEWVMASISLFNGKLTPVFTCKVTVLHLALVHVAKCMKDGPPSACQESMLSVGVQCCLVGEMPPIEELPIARHLRGCWVLLRQGDLLGRLLPCWPPASPL